MDEAAQKAVSKHLKRIAYVVAAVLILYGVLHLLNIVSGFTDFSISPYLWVLFQIVIAALLIFVGFEVYSLARTIKRRGTFQHWSEPRLALRTCAVGFMVLLAITLYPFPTLNLFPVPLYSSHEPISFSYTLRPLWSYKLGGFVEIITRRGYSVFPYRVFMDVIFVRQGWIAVPYKIALQKGSVVGNMAGPAVGGIVLGNITDCDYFLKIMMSNVVDLFRVRRQGNKFWVEEAEASMGSVVQMSDFEMRIDGFTVRFDSETSEQVVLQVLDLINQAGAEIIDAYSPQDPTRNIRFYFDGSFSKLKDIIQYLTEQYPDIWIDILSNAGP